MGGNELRVDLAGDQRRDVRAGVYAVEQMQSPSGKVRDARCEPEPEQMAKREHMIGDAASIDVMLLDAQLGTMMEQAVEHMRGLTRGR